MGELLFVSHDRYFINRFATRIWAMGGGELKDYRMGYGEYRDYLERQRQLAQTAAAKAPGGKKPERAARAVSRERQAARIEREIAQTEEKIGENEQNQEAAATDYERLMELTREHQELTERLEALYTQWEEVSQ